MRIRHVLPGVNVEKEGTGNSLILGNSRGGFVFLSDSPKSKHNGLFVSDKLGLFKILDGIYLLDEAPIHEIENHLSSVKRIRSHGNHEEFIMPFGCDGLIYGLTKRSKIAIDFDCRKADDLRQFGRHYEVRMEDDNIILRFTKKTDKREDKSDGEKEYEIFVAIKPITTENKGYEFIDKWHEQFYPYDELRKDHPASRWVYRPFILESEGFFLAAGKSEGDALDELDYLWAGKDEKHHSDIVVMKQKNDYSAAFICAQDSLKKLGVHHEKIDRLYAGLPWFTQFWTRDEAISIHSLAKLGSYDRVKDILLHYLRNMRPDGRIPNRDPASDLASADGVGWVFKRLRDLFVVLKGKDCLSKHISLEDMDFIQEKLLFSIENIESSHMKYGLIHNSALETWMDTKADGDTREGARIEIQCLHLNMLRFAYELTADKKFKEKEDALREEVRKVFWDGMMLADGQGDKTIRPNVFIAYYLYPELLEHGEWEIAFDECIRALWLDWGGFATIDKESRLFQSDYTGADNRSYHRGDSWFWLNNLAAICLRRVDPVKYWPRIEKIMNASSEEMLWRGAIGHHSEVSSAKELSSHGCFAQAWSAAMFVELIYESFIGGEQNGVCDKHRSWRDEDCYLPCQ